MFKLEKKNTREWDVINDVCPLDIKEVRFSIFGVTVWKSKWDWKQKIINGKGGNIGFHNKR